MSVAADQKLNLKPNQALLYGRVNSVRRADEYTYSEITLPAVDQYTPPHSVEVRSKKRLGQSGDTVEILVSCGGYRAKSFQYLDKETGEKVTRKPVVNLYSAIED
ncbi:hypothetical protein HQN60_01250 [Deefgea piscis]|uniref:Single-stranded DNA-binding protein n=1 Tax=Deefgea piscis TaxID=2739061 RepID=A0A6M8SPK6_9NEIS|nr:hypothetical protein [Deefgea piscis]QKJ65470.1 hypothetical protein HQN60_01250 [Deefgea piscis]